ncbi:MAG: helix-turn-helix domain-containing protein [Acidimicrobiaceae bacterium]|nr:helix-turn-helix domain-containing protein [Acidimicrobiaceae bacterium]
MTQEVVILATLGQLRRCIRSLRRRRGWQQATLGAAIGRSQQWVSGVESGRADPSLGDVIAVLSALGATIAVRSIESDCRAHD